MEALIDSAVLVDLYRNYRPAVEWMKSNQEVILGISSIVWLEMSEGTQNKLDQKLVANLLARFPLVYLDQTDQEWAMRQFANFHLSHNVGILDCLIAAPSHRLQLPLYTANLKHFIPLLGDLAQKPY